MMRSTVWVDVCPLDKLTPGRGVCALVGELQIAVFRIVGSKAERLKVASPIYKQSFDLVTGVCLDDATVTLPTYEVRVIDGMVQVASP
jgi:nitrite reductase (NADH) small subunit